jgi:hypothetical protein
MMTVAPLPRHDPPPHHRTLATASCEVIQMEYNDFIALTLLVHDGLCGHPQMDC